MVLRSEPIWKDHKANSGKFEFCYDQLDPSRSKKLNVDIQTKNFKADSRSYRTLEFENNGLL